MKSSANLGSIPRETFGTILVGIYLTIFFLLPQEPHANTAILSELRTPHGVSACKTRRLHCYFSTLGSNSQFLNDALYF